MILVCVVIATILLMVFIILFLSAGDSVVEVLLNSYCEVQNGIIKDSRIALHLLNEEIKRTQDFENRSKQRQVKKLEKQITSAEKLLGVYENRKISGLDLIPVAGYRAVQLLGWDSSNNLVNKITRKCMQFKEKKEAISYTYYLLGNLFGYLLLATAALFAALAAGIALNLGNRAFLLGIMAFVLLAVIGYLPYDRVDSTIRKREEDISASFPPVISKMALLTVAGMEVNTAWNLTAASGRGVLYEEMSRVALDFENNVSPSEAYSRFMDRCNNKYTTKLGTAVLQNMSKGNAEIVRLFQQLNAESWMEHKHSARRMGEKIQGKLLLPTVLMFIGILILVIVPVMSGFNMF